MMMRSLTLSSIALASLTLALPAAAQQAADPDEIAKLRADVDAAQRDLERLQARLDALEGGLATTEPAQLAHNVERNLPDQSDPEATEFAAAAKDRAEAIVENGVSGLVTGTGGLSEQLPTKDIDIAFQGSSSGGRVSLALSNNELDARSSDGLPCIASDEGLRIGSDNPCKGRGTPYTIRTTKLIVSAPANKSGDTSFATLDSLASGVKAELNFASFDGETPSASEIRASTIYRLAVAECLAKAIAGVDCYKIDDAFLATLAPATRDAWNDYIFEETLAGARGISVGASLGYNEYSYFDTPTLMKDKDREVGFGVSAGLLLFPRRGSSLLLEGEYQYGFKEAKSQITCPTDIEDDADFFTCIEGPLAAPTRTDKFIMSAAYRQQIEIAGGTIIKDLAIAPTLQFDVLNDDLSIDVPVYLVRSKKDGLVAGIRLGWEDEDDESDFKIGIFYGQAFDLFGN
ncbi:hypothetical protein [Sphingomicrobium sediminis]|uniref:Porin n=1 Tax=Sphingomicrobium sediminis TaxID=2950949 RepID=A0A9X2J2P1_9SPHN|nr:hypothetical protein [Sphingomicrobium sediminis]MCM8557230.1 hypothetical protein [Sphingomicrobium sediminis]